jgi:hypothetical protein
MDFVDIDAFLTHINRLYIVFYHHPNIEISDHDCNGCNDNPNTMIPAKIYISILSQIFCMREEREKAFSTKYYEKI